MFASEGARQALDKQRAHQAIIAAAKASNAAPAK
jgi:hypothetical protein